MSILRDKILIWRILLGVGQTFVKEPQKILSLFFWFWEVQIVRWQFSIFGQELDQNPRSIFHFLIISGGKIVIDSSIIYFCLVLLSIPQGNLKSILLPKNQCMFVSWIMNGTQWGEIFFKRLLLHSCTCIFKWNVKAK